MAARMSTRIAKTWPSATSGFAGPVMRGSGVTSEGWATALGELANEDLRAARMSAHAAFDPLWKDGEMSGDAAYDWLSTATKIPRIRCRIAKLDADERRRVVAAIASRSDPP